MHERQTARMRTRSEWFLSGVDRVDSLDVSNDMHLRPPIGHPGMGTYRSQDDLTRYRNDNLLTFDTNFFLYLQILFYLNVYIKNINALFHFVYESTFFYFFYFL